VSKLHERPS